MATKDISEAVKADFETLFEKWKEMIFELGYRTAKSEIVHCKDCKYWDPYFRLHGDRFMLNGKEVSNCEKFENYHTDSGLRPETAEDFYCAFGERKDEE